MSVQDPKVRISTTPILGLVVSVALLGSGIYTESRFVIVCGFFISILKVRRAVKEWRSIKRERIACVADVSDVPPLLSIGRAWA
jgi:hypothetical protein